MKKWVTFLIALLLISNIAIAYATQSTNYLVGRDIAPGNYKAELYAADEKALIGVAVCMILRPVEGSYKSETIQTDDMTLTNNNPDCELELLEGDRLLISCSDGYKIRLVNLSGADIEDEYPGAIEGVNLTKAINLTLSAIENYPDMYPGLKSAEIKYNDLLPSIELMLHMEYGEKDNYEAVVHNILFSLNIACHNQNNEIKESVPFYHGGIYDDITVVIGVYDNSILYTDAGFDTYYILPGTFDILKFE